MVGCVQMLGGGVQSAVDDWSNVRLVDAALVADTEFRLTVDLPQGQTAEHLRGWLLGPALQLRLDSRTTLLLVLHGILAALCHSCLRSD